MKKLLFLLSIILIFYAQALARDVYKIGMIGNTSSAISKAAVNTAELLVEKFNNTNNAYDIEVVFIDENKGNTKDKIRGIGNLIAVIGCFGERHKEVFDNVKDVAFISFCSQYSDFTENSNNFRVSASETELARIQARIDIVVFNHRKFAVIYEEGNDEYLKKAEAYRATVKKNKVVAAYFRSVKPDRKDFTKILIRLRDLKVRVIYYLGTWEQAARISKQAKKLNVGAVFTSTGDIFTRQFAKKAKAGANGAEFVTKTPPSLHRIKKFRAFMKEYGKRYTEESRYMPYIHDAVSVVLGAAEAGEINKDEIINRIKETKRSGILGKIRFDEKGERLKPKFYFYVVRGKEFLLMSSRTYMSMYNKAR